MCPGCCSELPESNMQQLPTGQRALVALLNRESVCEATKSISHDQKKSRCLAGEGLAEEQGWTRAALPIAVCLHLSPLQHEHHARKCNSLVECQRGPAKGPGLSKGPCQRSRAACWGWKQQPCCGTATKKSGSCNQRKKRRQYANALTQKESFAFARNQLG